MCFCCYRYWCTCYFLLKESKDHEHVLLVLQVVCKVHCDESDQSSYYAFVIILSIDFISDHSLFTDDVPESWILSTALYNNKGRCVGSREQASFRWILKCSNTLLYLAAMHLANVKDRIHCIRKVLLFSAP